ncbi:MAG: VOC family protein [Candidatus Kapaibacterium sp.]|jgi:catechol 2,3-dioxygenase-like lactoylglutathione lyase family enzyme
MQCCVHHIEINVSDLIRSLAFYRMLAEFISSGTLEEHTNAFSWKFDGWYLWVNQTQEKFLDRTYHRKTTGLDHLAFRLNSKEEILALEQHLILRGIPILSKADNYGPNYFAVFFEDPDRFKLEFGANL